MLNEIVAVADRVPEAVVRDELCLPRVENKAAGLIELVQLAELLGIGDFDSVFDSFRELAVGSPDEGPWLFAVPPHFVSRVAELSDPEVESIAFRWAKIEEFGGLQPPAALSSYIRQLRAIFAEHAGEFVLKTAL